MDQTGTILIDDNDLPVDIEDLEKFSMDLYTTYFEAANTYLTEYNNLKQNRSVESIMDL
jgi:hypothetical protein